MSDATSSNTVAYDTAIALIGMSGRFPGARNVPELWRQITQGEKAIRQFSDAELLQAGVDPELLSNPNYVKAGAILDDAALFDASFFKYAPREAEVTDPQHRLFLECAWEALEDAGYDPERYPDLISVFAGTAFSTYLLQNLIPNRDLMSDVGYAQASVGNDKDSLASTVSYKLNLRGPGISVQTFCSTSLVATHMASQSLLNYECDIALAGGVALMLPQVAGYLYEEGGILSPDGVCRALDGQGQGSVMGNGAGVVALKRLEDALEDGDQIYAILLGSSVNNDGSIRVSYTAPGLNGQTEVIAQAISNAGVDVESIGYIETHGTGTALGDSVELAAMKKAFARGTDKTQFCAIGSVKPNIGHLDRASGVTGLIKAALALKHQQLPPSLDFESASADLNLEQSPFYVNTQLQAWKQSETPRRAGVSSFGVGGTNAHIVLEEAPVRAASDEAQPWQLLTLSAKSATALTTASENLAAYLAQQPELNLADAAYTLQVGRGEFNYRRIVISRDLASASSDLYQASTQAAGSSYQVNRDRPVSLVYTGTGETLTRLAWELYRSDDAFQSCIEECASTLASLRGPDLLALFELEHVSDFIAASVQTESCVARIIAFASTYALTQSVLQAGIQPQIVWGTSQSLEIVACVCGVLSLRDALKLALQHGQASLEGELATLTFLRTLSWQAPRIPLGINEASSALSSEQATDPGYWSQQWQHPHDPAAGIKHLLTSGDSVLLEIGHSGTAFTIDEQYVERLVAGSAQDSELPGRAALLTMIGQLWLAGVTLDWQQLHSEEKRRRVSLPTYPFERKRYWIDEPQTQKVAAQPQIISRTVDSSDWFYQAQWQEQALTAERIDGPQTWLVFPDQGGWLDRVGEQLQSQGHRLIRVYAGAQFAQLDDTSFSIRVGEEGRDYTQLSALLAQQEKLPFRVLHGWGIQSDDTQHPANAETFKAQQEQGFYSLIFLARALSEHLFEHSVQLLVFSSHLQKVNEQDWLQPEHATMLGACKVIPQEPLNINCRSIDLEMTEQAPVEILAEACSQSSDLVIAYRQGVRQVQSYRALPLPASSSDAVPLRQHGVYLITGGFGGIGLALAEYLSTTYQARLILSGRTALPERDEWDNFLRDALADEAVKQKISLIQRLESAGSEVLLCKGDVADAAYMQQMVQAGLDTFGAINGVFHAAGLTAPEAFQTIQDLTVADCEAHFQSKVYGTYALAQALAQVETDFCLLFSSLSAVLGGLAFSAYASANIFLDAAADYYNGVEQQKRWISVNWDTWQVRADVHGSLGATIQAFAMSADEGIEALTRVLVSGHTHLVNSTGDLEARLRQWVQLESLQSEHNTSNTKSVPTVSLSASFVREEYEQQISEVWRQVLGVEQVGLYENFFDLGGNSLIALDVISRLKKLFHRPIPAVALFEAPTISALVTYLQPAVPVDEKSQKTNVFEERRRQARTKTQQTGIAIVGMSGRFPGASDVEQFWQHLRDGVESITPFSDAELLEAGVDPSLLRDPDYVKARPVLEQVDQFDANFFGYSPREAELTDPQHRLFLECAWEALEQAGYDCQTYDGLVGVFGGTNMSMYLLSLVANGNDVQALDGFQIGIGNDKDSLTTTVSYKLNLRGPSFAVQTFCSTSLVATHLACQSLAQGECDLAMAGGISVRVPDRVGYMFQEGGQESSDGHCRAFDEKSEGSVLGDGVGIVVLKRLEDALADGDTIHAVIKGSAINNDGSLKVSYSAPSVVGQANVVTQALENAGVSAESIGYIEAHGTGTELGDPIEIASLTRAFRVQTEQSGYCAVGSLKTNVGHLDRAAGVAGLIKAVMALKHGQIPPTLHFQAPNPEIDFEQSPFFVNNHLLPWTRGEHPRRAGVNSLGMGGTNAHVVLEEAPEAESASETRPMQLLLLSAKTESALQAMARRLRQHLQEQPEQAFADVAATLQRGRSVFEQRRMLVCRDRDEALAHLEEMETLKGAHNVQERRDRAVAFLFPGVGEQSVGLTRELYEQEPVFRQALERCCEIVKRKCQLDLLPILYPPASQESSSKQGLPDLRALLGRASSAAATPDPLARTDLAQPIVFSIEYALATLWMQWGIEPKAMLGYSLGEYVAACLAGVFSLEDALTLVTRRAQLIQQTATGKMLIVALSPTQVQPYLSERVSLAIVNTPFTCVLAGDAEALDQLEAQFQRQEIACSHVKSTHAFHSHMLQPLRASLLELVQSIPLQAPQISYLSNVTGTWITAEQATDPTYWADHMCQTVQFAAAVEHLLRDTEHVLLEIGPGQGLSSFVRQHPACERPRFTQIVSSLAPNIAGLTEQGQLLFALGKLWLAGVTPDWDGFYADERRRRIPLPTYPFERQRYWLAGVGNSRLPALGTIDEQAQVALTRKPEIADWFYRAVWQKSSLPAASQTASPLSWLIFVDKQGLGRQLGEALKRLGHSVIEVAASTGWDQLDASSFTISSHEPQDYARLFSLLAEQGRLPQRILHCWQASEVRDILDADAFREQQEAGFYSLLYLAKGLSPHLYDEPVQIIVLSTGLQEVLGDEELEPAKATLLGACKVISQEPLNLVCRSVDIELPVAGGWNEASDLTYLIEECTRPATDFEVAYRQGARWRQQYADYALEPQASELPVFRQQGVYLITGGLGGIGLALAEHLAQTVQARLVLLGRSGLPPRHEWSEWLSQHETQDEISQKILRVQALEDQGSQILIYRVDVTDARKLEEIVQDVLETFGDLHGVFHAAGLVDEKYFKALQDIERTECEQHFQSKVYGTQALAQALYGLELDFCFLFSSLSAVLGGLGFAAYAAANGYLDAFARRENRYNPGRWRSVNWDTWEVRANAHGSMGGTIAAFAMSPAEAIEGLTRAIMSGETHLINSTGDLHARLRQWIRTDLLLKSNQTAQPSTRSSRAGVPVGNDYEQIISGIWQEVLGFTTIGLYDNFFDLGGNSLIALEVINKLKKALRRPIPAVALFEAPTISLLTKYLQPEQPEPEQVQERESLAARRGRARQRVETESIAIVSMSGRFPGASTLEQFWDNLSNGVESIRFFTPEELEAAGIDPEVIQAPNYVPARPMLPPEIVEQFDAAFFGYSPREAELTDPQHRLFLECAWEALERAGYDTQTYEGLIGIYGGTNISTYLFSAESSQLAGINDYQLMAGNDKDSLTSSVSYKLNLRGPSLAVQTFCSTSLVAVHLASQSLLNGESDMALAGGSSIRVPMVGGHLYEPGGMESPDGHCHTFDAEARGSMFGDGVGVVLLKRLSDALEDGDYIHAVIKGSAINNDGSMKVSYAAPGVVGQAEVVQAALTNAGVAAADISYLEAHGTATELGDPIEVTSLTKAFRTQTDKNGYCPIGSVKTNVGHLDRAAGVSGLIKTVLALQHEAIPPSLNYETPNPEIDFEQSPFFVNTQLRPWPRTQEPRLAGINSLGMGGTNAHVIVEESPLREPSGASRPWQLLLLSARSQAALDSIKGRLHDFLEQHPRESLADVAYTLQKGRRRFEHRMMLLCKDQHEAVQLLALPETTDVRVESRTDRPLAFLFPGVGELTPGLSHELYLQEPAFREAFDHCCTLLQDQLGVKLQDLLFSTTAETLGQPVSGLNLRDLLGRNGNGSNGHDGRNGHNGHNGHTSARNDLRQTHIAQPLTFALEYALAQLLLHWGVQPQAMLGYSLGEYVVACLAGVFSLEDALKLVAQRALWISELPAGEMVAVSLAAEQVESYLNESVNLAIINSPNACVLAGPTADLADVCERLQRDDIAYRYVETTHAFHSQMLSSLQERVTHLVQTLTLHEPRIPYVSNVTGSWITAAQATDPAYWSRHMCQTVRFAEGVGTLLHESEYQLLEVGPGQALSSFVRQHPECTRERMALVSSTLPPAYGKEAEHPFLLKTLGRLWMNGVTIDWTQFYQDERRLRIPLPTYPFERQRYWLESRKGAGSILDRGEVTSSIAPQDIVKSLPREALKDWFYVPIWQSAAPLTNKLGSAERLWVCLLDDEGVGDQLVEQLMQRGGKIVTVRPGRGFARLGEDAYQVSPAEKGDYALLLQDLQARGEKVEQILHLWSVGRATRAVEAELELGFYSLFSLAQAIGDADLEQCQITIISNDVQNVTGNEALQAARATLMGPCRVLPQEYVNIRCRAIDITLGHVAQAQLEKVQVAQLLQEVLSSEEIALLALRGKRRWISSFEKMSLASDEGQSRALRHGGTYLITGGLGGIGLAMANWLAREYQAKLVLLGRHALPPRQLWEQTLLEDDGQGAIGRRIQQVLALEALGAEVLVVQVDVSNLAQMRSAIEQAQQRFGQIYGVLHTAGVPGVGLTQLKTRAQASEVLAAKVSGTLVLEEVLRDNAVELLVLFSSVTAMTGGGPGQIDYSAANAFLGAYAQSWSQRPEAETRRVVAVDWGEWQWNAWEAGLAGYDVQIQAFLKENRQQFGISFEEGVEALERLLATEVDHAIVSTQNFSRMAEQSKQFSAAYVLEQELALHQQREKYPRPALGVAYVPARNEAEQRIVTLWEELLGVSSVGINDNFFELGGNSLNGIDLMARLRKMFQLETFASHLLYEAPTIAMMAQYIEHGSSNDVATERLERGEKRRASQQQRTRASRKTR